MPNTNDVTDEPYIGYCEDCGAKHEVEGDENCMCGGEIRPKPAGEKNRDRGEWHRCPSPCSVCDAPYDAAMSGTVADGAEESIPTDSYTRICVEGPRDDDGVTVVYFHHETQVER